MRKNGIGARRNAGVSKQALVESIMTKIEPIIRQAVNEGTASPMAEILIGLMTKMKVNKVPFPQEHHGGHILLKDGKLTYIHGPRRYYTHEEYAFKIAYNVLSNDIDAIEEFRKMHKTNEKLTSNVLYIDFDRKDYNRVEDMNSYRWPDDIRDSGVIVNRDGSVTGTIDQLRKFKSFASKHGRYSRSTYDYENGELKFLLEIGHRYDLFEPFDSFDEYYHGGIVD